jgi:tyrosine-protein phosphatase SIW14
VRSTRVFSRTYIAAALAFITLLAPSSALATRDAARDAALAAIGIDNFGVINDNYYRGAQPQGPADYERLAALGVRTVIALQADYATKNYARTEEADVRAAGMKFHRIPMTTRTPPTAKQVASFMRIVNDPASQPVYVHCKGGKHRTGVMTAVFRMMEDDWSADQAYEEMKRFEFGPSFLHPEFKEFVYDYHMRLAAARPAGANAAAPAAAQ